jgi:hydroxyethylthiazole kinase-like uncharacterized protein yjeF
MMSPEGLTEVSMLPGLPLRARDAHKGDFGHVLVVGGSPGMTGAACLAAMAAQRAGAGLVTLAVPCSLNPVVETKLTSAMSWPLPEDEGQVLGVEAARRVLAEVSRFDMVAVGPGLGRDESTRAAARMLVENLPCPAVVDADALNALAGATAVLRAAAGPRMLTPHPGEMGRLIGRDAGQVQADRWRLATTFAREYGVVVALKGAASIVTDGCKAYTNPSGNPGMASGGTGDVLTGLVAGLHCQGLSCFDALCLGVFVHGLAGDLAARRVGELSLVAEDLLDCAPEALSLVARWGAGAEASVVLDALRNAPAS